MEAFATPGIEPTLEANVRKNEFEQPCQVRQSSTCQIDSMTELPICSLECQEAHWSAIMETE